MFYQKILIRDSNASGLPAGFDSSGLPQAESKPSGGWCLSLLERVKVACKWVKCKFTAADWLMMANAAIQRPTRIQLAFPQRSWALGGGLGEGSRRATIMRSDATVVSDPSLDL